MANALADIYADYAAAETAIELIDDTKILAVFAYRPAGSNVDRIVVVRKT